MFKKITANKKRSIIVALGLGFLVLVVIRLIVGFGAGERGPGNRGKQPVFVELGQATFGVMREVGLYYGSLTAAQKFSVAARVGGQVEKILTDIGDQVDSGQLLVMLDDDEYRLARDQAAHNVQLAEAQYAEAEANLRLAQSDMNRQSNLAGKRIVSQSDFETAENKLRQAEARALVAESQLRGAKSQLADAALKLSYTQISSTWPGGGVRWIGERLVDEGDLVTPNTPLLSVVSLDPLLVVVEVIEKDYPKIKIGMEAELRTEAWPGEVFRGRVLRIAPVLSATSRQARVELEVVNTDLRLKPGMFAEVVFIFKEVQNVWSVPQDVPFRRQDGFVIFVADKEKNTVKMVPVSLGLVDNGRVELVGVPAIDGPVVFLGQHMLEDGQAYRLPEELSPLSKYLPPEGFSLAGAEGTAEAGASAAAERPSPAQPAESAEANPIPKGREALSRQLDQPGQALPEKSAGPKVGRDEGAPDKAARS